MTISSRAMSLLPENVDRYHRQKLLAPIGAAGQERLGRSHAVIIGVGALGSCSADLLARAGVGKLTLIDRDFVDPTNLQRQTLYTEADVAANLPKAEAARRRLGAINSDIEIYAIVDDVNPSSIERYASDADVLIDGLDNFETRYLLNDLAVRNGIGYVYGGAVSTHGMSATFLPHAAPGGGEQRRGEWSESQATPCLRCIFDEPPPAGSSMTCDTAGVLGPVVTMIGSIQAAEAIKILTGNFDSINRDLVTLDAWHNEIHRLSIGASYQAGGCKCCGLGRLEYLEGHYQGSTGSLCGRDMVQIVPASAAEIDLAELAGRLARVGEVASNDFFVRATIRDGSTDVEITVFPNGRTLVKGVDRVEQARAIHARYIGA